MLSNVKIQTLGLILVSLIGLLAAAFITSAVETRSRIGQIETVWHSFELERSGKTQALYRMYAALGYGGMIHNIKNFGCQFEHRFEFTLQAIHYAKNKS